MKAWQLERLGGDLRFNDVRTPELRPGSVLVRIEASALMSYLKAYVEGKLPVYNPPPGSFTLGTNGVGDTAVVAPRARGAFCRFCRAGERRRPRAGPDRTDLESGRGGGSRRLAGRHAGRIRA